MARAGSVQAIEISPCTPRQATTATGPVVATLDAFPCPVRM